jgi:hypothetical protein
MGGLLRPHIRIVQTLEADIRTRRSAISPVSLIFILASCDTSEQRRGALTFADILNGLDEPPSILSHH